MVLFQKNPLMVKWRILDRLIQLFIYLPLFQKFVQSPMVQFKNEIPFLVVVAHLIEASHPQLTGLQNVHQILLTGKMMNVGVCRSNEWALQMLYHDCFRSLSFHEQHNLYQLFE